MAFTHVEIEEHKTRQLVLLFMTLVALYAVSIVALVWGIRLFLGFSDHLSGMQILGILGVALLVAVAHWLSSIPRLVDRVLTAILAHPIDPADSYHAQFKNITEEVAVATGGRHKIEPYVISTPAMNACAIADFSGRSAIALTEGMLARLNRAQLESVVGHEAAHIASGDSLAKSVFCGLFGLHEEALKRLSGLFSGRAGWRVLRGRGAGVIIFVMVILWITNKTKRFCELLISRTQEYRADAVAVRLTRNPLGLAEALRLMSKRWRGVGAQGESLSTIFIMDPGTEYLSEREGVKAELFSTHPPTERRIEALLGMTHIRPEDFEQAVVSRPRRMRQVREAEEAKSSSEEKLPRWFMCLGGVWKGPLAFEEISGLKELAPDSWVRQEGKEQAVPASRDPHMLRILKRRYGGYGPSEHPTGEECPSCRVSLTRVEYEGVPLDECPACRGCYVTPNQMTRIFAREDYAFSDEVRRLAKTVSAVRGGVREKKQFGSLPYKQRMEDRKCTKCGGAVIRKFYTEAYMVEVEQCWMCGLAWLDKGELELLQYLYEERKSERK